MTVYAPASVRTTLLASVNNIPFTASQQSLLSWVNNTSTPKRVLIFGTMNIGTNLTGGQIYALRAGDASAAAILVGAGAVAGNRSIQGLPIYVDPGLNLQVIQASISAGAASCSLEYWSYA